MFQGAKIQLLDLPGIIEGAKDGKGRGKQVIAVARTCHLIFICLDVLKPLGHKKIIEHELEGFGIRLNKKPPNILFKQKEKGGLNLNCQVEQSELDKELVQVIKSKYHILKINKYYFSKFSKNIKFITLILLLMMTLRLTI